MSKQCKEVHIVVAQVNQKSHLKKSGEFDPRASTWVKAERVNPDIKPLIIPKLLIRRWQSM